METKEKSTKDLDLAAAFLASGAIYERADKTNPKNMEFFFTPRKASTGAISSLDIPTQDLDFIESQWANKTLLVNAVEYAEAFKRLKSIIHSK